MKIIHFAQRHLLARYSSIFISMLTIVVLLIINRGEEFLSTILFSFATVSGIFLASSNTRETAIALLLAVPWLVLSWIKLIYSTALLPPIFSNILIIVFMGFITALIFRHLTRAKEVTADLLFGASAAYLMIGILFALFYYIVIDYNPEAVAIPSGNTPKMNNLVYFSFTTITTLGYGDVLSVSPIAKAISIIEAITGVLYTAIIISRLMGLYIATALQDEKIR